MKKYPILSIITVTYNAGRVLERTIRSILDQKCDFIEFIIIDGASTDDTINIAEKYKESINKIISEPDNGLYDAMNKGLSLASGEFVCFLNAGDYFCNDRIIHTVFSDNDYGNFDLIYGDAFLIDQDFNKIRELKAGLINKKKSRKGMVICHQSMFVRRSIAPLYDLNLVYKAELNWLLDIMESTNEERIKYHSFSIVDYMVGGFSQQHFYSNFKELVALLHRRFGLIQTFINIPRYIRLFIGFYFRKHLNIHTFRFWTYFRRSR